MPVNLLPNPYSRDSKHANAYDQCIMLETHAPNLNSKPPALVCARLLGYLLIHAPADKGRDNVADDILDCQCNENLIELADFFITHLLYCFKAIKIRTSTPSNHPSNPEFENIQEMLGYLLEESPKDHSTAKRMALARDGYRCIITGLYDTHSCDKFSEIKQEAISYGQRIVITNAAHIFHASTNHGISGEQEGGLKYKYASGVSADMIGIPASVTFISKDKNLPLPDPRYLRMHAACAKVAHLSGAAEYIDVIFRDMEDTRVLATDGSSAELLGYALRGNVELAY